eukprot:snap_masked-scaffold_50-processed-gene-0.38-mRNA-1 protein AED:1.00 eAED:1.00 QI:0/0/0/0/1/1/2/0/64
MFDRINKISRTNKYNASHDCEVNADCPRTAFCVEKLWFSESVDSSGCMCQLLCSLTLSYISLER